MADYENLLDSIDAVIRANNRREITGQILQNTLHQMVGSLGENYQLAGFATPTTNPNSPDQNVFYITDEAGVYTNFDNITLGTGLSFLMWKNEAWTAKTLNVVTAQWVDNNYVSKAFLRNMFRFYDEDGVEIFANDTQSVVDNIKAMVGLWTEQYLSALGLGDDSGGGGAGDVTWELLADNTDTRPIAISHLTSALSDYATQSWVQQQGYATQAALNALEYLNSVNRNNGAMVLSTNKGNSFVVDFTHEHSWFDIQYRPNTIAGYGLDSELNIVNGVITIGGQSITPVTSVAMSVPLGLNVSGSPITKTGTLAVTYANGYEGFTTALKEKIEVLFSWFEVDESGNVKTKDYTENDTLKHRGFYSPSFISALGMGDDGGGGGQGDVTWTLLADNTDTRQIALSHLTGALVDYVTTTSLSTTLASYATQAWVNQQGFALQSSVNALEFLNNITSTEGYVTFITNKNNNFVVDFTHQHSWFEIQDRPTTISGFDIVMTADDIPALDWSKITTGKPTTLVGYGVVDAKIENGVITLGSNTITPVTSVAMTMPTGFGVTGSPISKTGTLAVTYSNGYEGFTTALKEKIEALFSWFELDSDGNVKTKDWDDNGTTKHRGFYSPSFISALGLGSDGSAGSGDVTWALLADNNDTRQIALSHLTIALTDYATTATVNALEFFNAATGGDGCLSLITNKSNTTIIDLTHEHSWFDIQDRPDTIAGYNITDAKIFNGTITLGANSITPLTQHQSLANYYTKAETNSAISTAIGALEYLNQASGGSGVLTLTTNKSNSFVVDFTHQHSYLELIDRPTTISGYGITDAITTSNIGSQSVNYASSAGSATSASKLSALATITYGQNSLQYCDKYSDSSSNPTNAVGNPTGDWYHHIVMNHANSGGYFVDLAVCFHSSNFWYRRIANGSAASWVRVIDTDNIGSQSVNYATSAGSASSATYATSAGSASSASYATSAGDSDTCDGLHVHSGRNNEANKIVRTDDYGYMQCGWINTSSGGFNGDISGITRVYCSEDDYIRYLSPSDFISAMSLLKNYGNNNSRPNGTTFTLPAGTNAVQMRSGATSGADIGIFHLSDDNAFVCNSSDEGYLFAAFDTDQTANFSTGDNAAFVVHSNHAGVSIKGNFYATGGVTCLSDERKKDVLGNINLSIEQIAYAPAVRFLWKDRRNNDVQAGSIAQYWQKVLPEVVTNKNNELGLQYGVTALMASIITAKAVVDHERRIKDLERENDFLKEQIKQLKAA